MTSPCWKCGDDEAYCYNCGEREGACECDAKPRIGECDECGDHNQHMHDLVDDLRSDRDLWKDRAESAEEQLRRAGGTDD